VAKIPKGKADLHVLVDKKVYEEIKRLALLKYEKAHGAISYEVEQALRNWIALHSQEPHKPIAKVNPQPKVFAVFGEVKKYLMERYDRDYKVIVQGTQIPRRLLVEAIKAVRGYDPRTVENWMRNFVEAKLIKHIAGEVYEVLW